MKPKERKPYLSEGERSNFQKQVETGVLSFFRITSCQREGCEAEVPRSVPYCSKDCWERAEGLEEYEDDQGEMD
ncbi:MAG: hypothetical protein ACWGQW_00740 [bacterium]